MCAMVLPLVGGQLYKYVAAWEQDNKRCPSVEDAVLGHDEFPEMSQ